MKLAALVAALVTASVTGCSGGHGSATPRPTVSPVVAASPSVSAGPLSAPPVSWVQVATFIVSGIALVVSVIALARPWWLERKASIEVRLERFPKQDREAKWNSPSTDFRFVVKNHGPARAKDVNLKYFVGDIEGVPGFLWPRTDPIPVLHATQEFHFDFQPALGSDLVDCVEVAWRDRRIGTQRLKIWPGLIRL